MVSRHRGHELSEKSKFDQIAQFSFRYRYNVARIIVCSSFGIISIAFQREIIRMKGIVHGASWTKNIEWDPYKGVKEIDMQASHIIQIATLQDSSLMLGSLPPCLTVFQGSVNSQLVVKVD